MEHKYTFNLIEKKHFGKTEAIDYLELLFSLANNPELKNTFHTWSEDYEDVEEKQYSPSQASINVILAYSSL